MNNTIKPTISEVGFLRSWMNWSGGKDSALALFKALQTGLYKIDYLFTSVNSNHDRVSMHGVNKRRSGL